MYAKAKQKEKGRQHNKYIPNWTRDFKHIETIV